MILLPSLDEFPTLFVGPVDHVYDGIHISPQEQSEYEILRRERQNGEDEEAGRYPSIGESYNVLNELRHQYAASDMEKSLSYANRLLAGFFMDKYTLNVLSNWQMNKDVSAAIRALLSNAQQFPRFYQVRSACLIQAAQLYEKHGYVEEARRLYRAFYTTKQIDHSNYFRFVRLIESLHSNLFDDMTSAGNIAEHPTSLSFEQVKTLCLLLQKHDMKPSKKLLQLARPGIRFQATGEVPQIGASRLGGLPDVPLGWEWPGELEFLAQFNLEEIAPIDTTGLLPKHGLLHIFAQSVADWQDEDNFQISLYGGDIGALSPATPPETFEVLTEETKGYFDLQVYRSVPVAPFSIISLPTTYSIYGGDEEDLELEKELTILRYELGYGGWRHQLLGHHGFIDGNASIEAWSKETGQSYYQLQREGSLPEDPEWEQWILLFQMDSCEEVGTSFSDAGIYYFMIRKDDLADRRFDRIYFSMWSS